MSNESNGITVVFIIRICFMLTLGLARAPLFQFYQQRWRIYYNHSHLTAMHGAGYEGVHGTAVG